MLDVVSNEALRSFQVPFGPADASASPGLALLCRQTKALEFIATQLCVLTSRSGQAIEVPVEMQPEYQLATRRLLQEAV